MMGERSRRKGGHRASHRAPKVDGAALLGFQMKAAGLSPLREFRFHPTRRWRSDYAFPDARLLVEFEGGVWTNGAHVRGKHFESDCEKYNAAALLGYRVLRFTIDMVKSGRAVKAIESVLCGSGDGSRRAPTPPEE